MNEELKEKLKLKIAISQMKEEEKMAMNKEKNKISKGIGLVACLVIATTGIVFAKDKGNFFINLFGKNASDGVQIAVDNGYVKKTETKYIKADGIEVTIDSFLIDDYNFDMNFKINLDDKYDIKEMQGLQPFDLKVIDENNEIVFLTSEAETMIAEENKTVGTQNFHPLFWGGYSMNGDIISDNEIMLHLTAYGSEEHKIPKSKKLYVTFSKVINKTAIQEGANDIYAGNWKFELDVPEKMYNRETIIYRMKSCNDEKTEVSNATLSNTAFKIFISETTTDKIDYELLKARPPKNASDMIALGKEYVETSDGKRFEPSGKNDGDGGYTVPAEDDKIVNYSQTFNLTKFDATDVLKVHIFTNKGEEIVIEYERNK